MKLTTIDFETYGIGPRPDEYPPKPVGVAILRPGKAPKYMAWGHPSENNCTQEEAQSVLESIWRDNCPMLFHNAPFDLEVANQWLGLPYPPWHLVHDTMLMAFLDNPHCKQLHLKSLADELLDMPPEEQDRLKEWVLTNVPEAKKKKTQWGRYICRAPGKLVGTYAKGDVVRTKKLYDYFLPNMPMKAYNVERKLQPILLRATILGVPINKNRLRKDLRVYERTLKEIDKKLRDKVSTPDLDVDSPKQLADALDKSRLINSWVLTAKGSRSVSAKALEISCKDKELIDLMNYRARLKTGLRTFGAGWLREAYDDRLHFRWNQVAGDDESGKRYGARTGRLSSNPNAQNMPKIRPEHNFIEYPNLPHPREYIIPEKGHILLGRDYSQQELRILAWYLGGRIKQAYIDRPELDLHKYAQILLSSSYGLELTKSQLKTIAFGILYGMSIKTISERLGVDVSNGRKLVQDYKALFEGLGAFQDRIKSDQNVTTWGGRFYDVEPPIMDVRHKYGMDGQLIEVPYEKKSFEYKLLNYAIQGSAADASKQAIINLDGALEESIFYLSVHDEFLISCPKGAEKKEMLIMNEAMLDLDFNGLEMRSEGKKSAHNWARMHSWEG